MQGETHVGGKSTKGRHGQGGVATDFLFSNLSNNSFAVVEIKAPTASLVAGIYRGNKNSGNSNETYSISTHVTGGLVQLENQIHIAMEDFFIKLNKDFKDLNTLDPCGVLLIGDTTKLSEKEKRSFDLFRKALGKNKIYTYDELLNKIKILKKNYA